MCIIITIININSLSNQSIYWRYGGASEAGDDEQRTEDAVVYADFLLLR